MERHSRPSGGADATSAPPFKSLPRPYPDPRPGSPRTFATDRDRDRDLRDRDNSQSTSSLTPSSSNSQETYASAPSASTSAGSNNPRIHPGFQSHANQASAVRNPYGNGHSQGLGYNSNRESSQLLALSQIAAASEKMPSLATPASPVDGSSRKRMADGAVKSHYRQRSSASPVFSGGVHSRNTSTVSVASTSASRISELSADLKTRLSYAMVKVNNGWQSHSIDQVESLASKAASPTSSSSTAHRFRSSASPRLAVSSRSQNSTPTSGIDHHFSAQSESSWRDPAAARVSPVLASPLSPPKGVPSLAPPISMQPSLLSMDSRRNPNPRHAPAYISTSHHAGPHTPGQPSPAHAPLKPRFGGQISPEHNIREQDAIETLLFMSSPNNSANLKHNFTMSSSQPLPSLRNGAPSNAPRTALPGSQPRKSLPNRRPVQQHHSQPTKRVGFDKTPGAMGAMEAEEPFGTPTTAMSDYSHGTPRRRVNGGGMGSDTTPRPKVALSAGLSAGHRSRPARGEDEIERMLSRVSGADSSDSEDEIPLRPRRAGSGGPVGV